MHRQDYWTSRTHNLRFYSLQVKASYKSISGNTSMEQQSLKIWSSKLCTTRTLTSSLRTWITIYNMLELTNLQYAWTLVATNAGHWHWGKWYRSDWSVGRWERKSGCKAIQMTCLAAALAALACFESCSWTNSWRGTSTLGLARRVGSEFWSWIWEEWSGLVRTWYSISNPPIHHHVWQ